MANGAGIDSTRLERVVSRIAADIDEDIYHGAALKVHLRGECVLDSVQGFSDKTSGESLTANDIFCTFSSGKQFTVVAVLNYIERGLLQLHTPVVDVIPEFAMNGKQRIRLDQLLSHTSGLIPLPPPVPPQDLGNLQVVVDAICKTAPQTIPGERVCYSILTAHAVMAEMVRRVDGGNRPFRQIVKEEVFDPLQMSDTALGLPDDLRERFCPVIVADRSPGLLEPETLEGMGTALGPETEIPAGGYVTSIGDFSRFAEMLRNHGALDGARVLSPAMIELVTKNYTGDSPNDIWNYAVDARNWPIFPASLGLGFFLRGEGAHPTPFGSMASPRTFGGVGAGSTTFFVDPEKQLSYAFLSTGLLEESRSTERHQRIADLVHSAVT